MKGFHGFPGAIVISSAIALVGTVPAWSAPPPAADADWPCQQRLVPRLAAATYWSGPSPGDAGDWHADPEVAELVRSIAPRRVSTEDGLTAIATFVRGLPPADRQRRIALAFRGLLDESDHERAGLIEELKEIGRRQRELSELVARLTAQVNAIPPDVGAEAAAKRTDLDERRDFTARNFEEIQRTIRYACETPVTLDARLGAWARALQQAAPH